MVSFYQLPMAFQGQMNKLDHGNCFSTVRQKETELSFLEEFFALNHDNLEIKLVKFFNKQGLCFF
jgi:hypothetical protein